MHVSPHTTQEVQTSYRDTIGRLGCIRPDSAHAIGGVTGGTAELAQRYSNQSHYRTKALISDYGPAGAAGARATPPHPPGPQYRYGTTGRRKQRVAVAELSVPQDLSKDYGPTGNSGHRRRLRRGRRTCKGLRAGRIRRMAMPGVHRGKRTNRPRDLPGAGRRVSPMLGILGQASTRRSTDRARAGKPMTLSGISFM